MTKCHTFKVQLCQLLFFGNHSAADIVVSLANGRRFKCYHSCANVTQENFSKKTIYTSLVVIIRSSCSELRGASLIPGLSRDDLVNCFRKTFNRRGSFHFWATSFSISSQNYLSPLDTFDSLCFIVCLQVDFQQFDMSFSLRKSKLSDLRPQV